MEGFLEGVEPFQVRGWVFDPAQPDSHVQVEIVCGDRILGNTSASLYRDDLARGGIGRGDHAFTLNLSTRLRQEDFSIVSARVSDKTGTSKQIKRLPAPTNAPTVERPIIEFTGIRQDESQRPVFVLGSARSGTSAIAQALIKATRYEGFQEGHLFDLLATFAVGFRNFDNRKFDERAGGRDTMIARVSRDYFPKALNSLFLAVATEVFSTPYWLDKTPNSDMIYLASRFREIWPNAVFVFMKRRAIENLVSRERKFPGRDFIQNCREWADAMKAWMAVRAELASCSIEIDQIELVRHPREIAERLAGLLNLDLAERLHLEEALINDRPERTTEEFGVVRDYEELDWDQAKRGIFEEWCGDLMAQFGYNWSASYFAAAPI